MRVCEPVCYRSPGEPSKGYPVTRSDLFFSRFKRQSSAPLWLAGCLMAGCGGATVQLDDLSRVPELVFALAAAGVRVTRVEPHLPSLEDLYFAVRTKKPIADDGGRQLTPTGDEAVVTDRHRQVAALTGWPGSEDAR